MIESVQAIDSLVKAMPLSVVNKTQSNEQLTALFTEQLMQSNETLLSAEQVLASAARGESIEPHDAMIVMSNAQLELSFMVEMRNKLVEAYQELMRMPV
jgi:flagellar hook-basal body complex protein FliE